MLSCSLDEVSLESGIQRFHQDTLKVAEVVAQLSLPVRGAIRRPSYESKLSLGPGSQLRPSWAQFFGGGPGPARRQKLESKRADEPLRITALKRGTSTVVAQQA